MFISKFLHLKQIQTLANLTLNLPEMINTYQVLPLFSKQVMIILKLIRYALLSWSNTNSWKKFAEARGENYQADPGS